MLAVDEALRAGERAIELRVRAGEGERILRVLEASTPEQRRLGLMFRYRNEFSHDGMLFRYPSVVNASFHMANTLMPLRIYWFNEAGGLVGAADLEAQSSTLVPSPAPFRYALEVPRDIAEELGDQIGLMLAEGSPTPAGPR
jgi:uncharacterized membrane protein (UPF0127 family)